MNDRLDEHEIEWLREKVKEAAASIKAGKAKPLDIESIKKRARAKYERSRRD